MARVKDLDRLQPEFRERVECVMAQLKGSSHDWQVYETWRQPKQKHVVSSVSKTNPFKNPSRHGYGGAVDIVPHGHWGGPWKKASWPGWDELRAAAHKCGLQNEITWDRPHVEATRAQITAWLQDSLGIEADGKWGPNTEKAAKAAAKDYGIIWRDPVPTASPRVHPTTYNELRAALGSSRVATGGGIVLASIAAVAGLAWYLYRKG